MSARVPPPPHQGCATQSHLFLQKSSDAHVKIRSLKKHIGLAENYSPGPARVPTRSFGRGLITWNIEATL